MKRFLRLPEVKRIAGMGTSAIYSGWRNGTFPRGVKTGPKITAWDSDEVEAWQAKKLAQRDEPPATAARPRGPYKKIKAETAPAAKAGA